MQQYDHRPVGRTFIDDIEDKLTASELLHRRSLYWRVGGLPPFATP
jgi:hypothetical protein